MGYQALYRRYRPRHFRDVIGQEHIVRTLLNAVRQDKIGHAYLFSGPRGTGKTTVARILARAINCEHTVDGEPCDECPRCKGTDEGLGVLEIDAASHGSVDDMRQLVAQVSQLPLAGGMMVYIIDEVHMLSKEAFNAFLKTLEEPPRHAVFVLATTEPGKLLPTIHSRCQHFAFRRLPIDLVAEHIRWICREESVGAEDAAIRIIARAGEGSVRDSISILEQAVAFEPEGLTLGGVREVLGIPDRVDIRKLAGHILASDPGGISSSFNALIELGREPDAILDDLLAHYRDLLFAALDLDLAELQTLPSEELDLVKDQAGRLSVEDIHKSISFLAKCEGEIKWEDEAALILEASLLRLAAGFRRKSASAESRAEASRTREESASSRLEERTETAKRAEPVAESETGLPKKPSLTGGLTLGKRRTASDPSAAIGETAAAPPETPAQAPVTEDMALQIPPDTEQFWKDALESIRELSIHEYIILAETEVSPAPSEWALPDNAPLQLSLKYPPGSGLVARLVSEPALLGRLTKRLEEVLERPVKIRVARGRASQEASDASGAGTGKADGENPTTGGPTLFPGVGRPVPADPEQRLVHDLIAEDFPDYRIEYDGPAIK
jgi:DNA polymerase-3 subunit gamma/tau